MENSNVANAWNGITGSMTKFIALFRKTAKDLFDRRIKAIYTAGFYK